MKEPGGQYLFHFTPDEDDKDPTAAALVDWMKKHGIDKTLKFIGGDSTNAVQPLSSILMSWAHYNELFS